MASNDNKGRSGKNRKVWGLIALWCLLFLIVKSIEKILVITAVAAVVYWGAKAIKGSSRPK